MKVTKKVKKWEEPAKSARMAVHTKAKNAKPIGLTVETSNKKVSTSKSAEKGTQQAAPTLTKKVSEIDDIFQERKKAPTLSSIPEMTMAVAKPRKKHPKNEGSASNPLGSQSRKQTEEGFKVYHEDELKIGKGGDTPLCPFDCNCCF
eukprot:GILJ01009408.1.p1 GENE.GILJ01009408.1~~GILJ01009408.1.p1  ORF type:complete len:147 (-),score=23.76 GILJ01009408.1:52-492(-)